MLSRFSSAGCLPDPVNVNLSSSRTSADADYNAQMAPGDMVYLPNLMILLRVYEFTAESNGISIVSG